MSNYQSPKSAIVKDRIKTNSDFFKLLESLRARISVEEESFLREIFSKKENQFQKLLKVYMDSTLLGFKNNSNGK